MMQRNWIEMMVRYSSGILEVPGVFIQGDGEFRPLIRTTRLLGRKITPFYLINPHKCNHTG